MFKLLSVKGRNKTPPSQGFTMLEVLMGIMTTTAFVAASLQLITINAMFKVKAERQAQALFWIQDDQESIRSRASFIKPHNSDIPAGQSSGRENYEPIYPFCDPTDGNYEPVSIALYRILENDYSTGRLSNLDSKNDWFPQETRTYFGKAYTMQRRYSIQDSEDKRNILTVEYRVLGSDGKLLAGGNHTDTSAIDTTDQIIPPEAFNCEN
jgi:hypothetical protein